MTAPESEALAAWLDASARVEDIPWPERAAKSRAAAAALRGLVAERDSLRDEAWAWMLCWGEEMANNERLRRKVARYIGKARDWRTACRWERKYGAMVGRRLVEARALGRALAGALDEAHKFLGGYRDDWSGVLARARAAGWLEG